MLHYPLHFLEDTSVHVACNISVTSFSAYRALKYILIPVYFHFEACLQVLV